ncbi:heparin lyase I family protein [unidentified bacterial endosymbiont]|uniref:heparin lyase I family protein n=1 Tax=unidentified bacterial endosymbiont TaxID=2355 RepID=UPI0020A07BC7|nr:heparin lyase I family protein [unidentified bacterial endosymbiont]
MLSALSKYSLSSVVNQPPGTVASTPAYLSNVMQNRRRIRRLDPHCVKISHRDKYYDPISHGRGRKLESIKTSFVNNINSLKKYSVSINTKTYTQLGPSGQQEKERYIDEKFLSFVNGLWIGKKDDRVLRFYLPKDKGNFRVELAHRNKLNMNTDSLYEFQMRAGYAARSVIFFQVKESGGNMTTTGRGKPPVSLHLKNEKEIHIAINSEHGSVLRQKIATLSCPQEWYNFKIRIVWNRKHPNIQVAINGRSVFETHVTFGAQNSSSHYSKFGIYVPQQKHEEGVQDTSFLFDNVKEIHRFAMYKKQR